MRGRSTRVAVLLTGLLCASTVLGMAPGRLVLAPEESLRTAPGYRTPAQTVAGFDAWQSAWLSIGVVPGAGTEYAEMAGWSLLDLRAFQTANGAVLAGPGGPWSHFWPRDGSFAAVAFAVSGHVTEAAQVLDQLSRLQFAPGGGFEARYAADGSPLTDRPAQSDGCGWVLWAIAKVRSSQPAAAGPSTPGLRDRCVRELVDLTDGGRRLPPPSPDYWEVSVDEVSLGTVGPIVAGLWAAAEDYRELGEGRAADAAHDAATRLLDTTLSHFGPGFERFADHGGLDAAVTTLLPPFLPDEALSPDEQASVRHAVASYARQAAQPAGGVAPGTDWVKRDGASWTPQTALLGLEAAAQGRPADAARWLDWLDAHRTAYGSLPEKVTRSGRPAGPAPLSWTAALTILTLDELDELDARTHSLPGG